MAARSRQQQVRDRGRLGPGRRPLLLPERGYEGRGFRVLLRGDRRGPRTQQRVRCDLFFDNTGSVRPKRTELVRRIGAVTVAEITATGLDWTFAPTVAVPRDYRWGRVYEGYSEDPVVVHAYASAMVTGSRQGGQRFGDDRVVSTVKHWGRGRGRRWVDVKDNHYTEDYLINLHAVGYGRIPSTRARGGDVPSIPGTSRRTTT